MPASSPLLPFEKYNELVNTPRLGDVLKRARIEAESRPMRRTRLEVVDYRPTDPTNVNLLALPGTVTVFFAPRGSKRLQDIRRAATAADGSDIALVKELKADFEARPQVSIEQAVEVLIQQSVIADIRHGSSTVAQNLFVPPKYEFGVVGFPYNGGQIAEEGISLVERHRPEADDSMEAVVLRLAPTLTEAEEFAIRKIPPDQFELNIGTALLCYAATGVGVAYAVAAVAVSATGASASSLDSLDAHLGDDVVAALKPGNSARRLLNMRRLLIEGS